MRAFRCGSPLLFTVFVMLALASSLSAQTVNPDLNPYGSYHGADFDSVTLPNGGLYFHIPLISYPQRGDLHLSFYVRNNAQEFTAYQECLKVCSTFWSAHGDGLQILPDLTYAEPGDYSNPPSATIPDYVAVTPDGSSHMMGTTTSSSNWLALDGSGFQYNSGTNILLDNNGVQYEGMTSPAYFPTKVEDRNGNIMTSTPAGSYAAIFTDTLGRSIPMASSPDNPNGQTSNFSGCTGTASTYEAYNWTLPGPSGGTTVFKICYAHFTVAYNPGACSPTSQSAPCYPVSFTAALIQSIVLPTGTAWTFAYDGYGDVASITLPTGGVISYIWSIFHESGVLWALPRISSRTINANDGTGSHTWTYSDVPSVSYLITTVSDPDGNQTIHSFGQPAGPNSVPYYPYFETEVQYYQNVSGTQNLLKTVATAYQTFSTYGPAFPTSITTTWPNGKVSQTQKTYDTGVSLTGKFSGTAILGQVTEQRDYDYGSGSPGSLLRRTDTAFMATPSSTYFTNGLLRIPSTGTVYNGSGTQMALTTYAYDATALQPSGVSSTYLDPSPTDGAYRGNPTSITRWLNTPAGNVVSKKSYWDTGELYISTSPNVNFTTYAYTCTAAYLNTVTDALGHVTTTTPDCNTGLTLSTKDENSQTTSHLYDSSWRVTQTNYPDGGLVTECYSDTAGSSCAGGAPYTIVTTTLLSSGNMIGTEVFDGFGRMSQEQTNSDPSGTDYIDSTYDELGRQHSQSTPYRTKSDPTYGLTTHTYDAMGRPTVTTMADNSTINDSYTGAAVEVADEGNGTANVTHVSQNDGLGHLVSVCEVTSATQLGTSGTPTACAQDVGATGFLTTYAYDALGDLTSVNQAGLSTRSFVYDSLARLVSDFNPESGTITYAYDGDSNVTSRVAPKPDQSSASVTVTTTYGYDQLDRLTSKTYSDGTTPSMAMTYDTQPSNSPGTLTHPVGRLVEASSADATTWESYDTMGRPAEEWQCTPLNCGSSSFALPYAYGPGGEMLTFTNGAGVTLTNHYDTAAQITGITSSLQDSNHPTSLLSNATYNALGQISSVTLGNGLTENYNYDNRLRLTSMTAGTVYSLTLGYAPDSDVTSVIDSANGSWTYSYDGFNRISASNKNSGSQAFTYAYDRYGSRWQQNVTAGSGPSLTLSFTGANNRVDGYSYDAAGNLMNDGSHSYTYDAENRIIQVDAGVTATYAYDAFGQRSEKSSAGVSVSYVYDLAGHEVGEVNSSGTWTRMEIHAGKHLATYSGGASGTTSFIHVDWLGTERVRTTVSGATGETCTSLPYGDLLSCSGTDVSPMHLTGKQRDTESNLDDFGARYYTSTMGRWMTPDWSAREEAVPYLNLHNPQSLNLYGYVGNNPTTATDPDGHARDMDGESDRAQGCSTGPADLAGGTCGSTTGNNQHAPSADTHPEKPSVFRKIFGKVGNFFTAIATPFIRWGKLGGPAHRAEVARQERALEEAGYTVRKEVKIKTPNGAKSSRWVDLEGTKDGETVYIQVGKENKDGTAVAREVRAADDIEGATGIRPGFAPYNKVPAEEPAWPEPPDPAVTGVPYCAYTGTCDGGEKK